MNNKNQVLELKQNGKNSLVYTDDITGAPRNGDYKARLANGGVYLNNGDTLRLNQVFLETDEVQEDVIVIEDTLTLRIDFIRYLKDVDNINRPIPTDRTYTGTSGSTTDPLTMSIPLDKTPSFLVNQNTFNAYGGGSFNGNNSHGYYQRKGEIYTEALDIGLNDFANNLNHRNLKSMTYARKDKSKPSLSFNCECLVKNSLNNLIKLTITVPPMSLLSEQTTVNIDFFCQKDLTNFPAQQVVKIINEVQLNEANIELERVLSIVPANFAQLPVFCPNIVSKTVRLTKGNYHAQELGQIITNLFTDSQLGSGQVLGNSASVLQQPSLMVLADQDLNEIGTDGADNLPAGDFFHQNASTGWRVFVKAKDSNRFNWYGSIGAMQRNPNQPPQTPLKILKNDPPIYAGSDSFALVYDSELNKFKFERLHTSIRDSTGNQPSVQVLDNPTITSGANAPFPPDFFSGSPSTYINSPQHSYLATSYGGIIMTNLSASKVDGGDYVDFWEKILGFNLDVITQKPTQTGNTLATKTGNNFNPLTGSDTIIDYQSDTEQIISYSFGGLKPNDNITDDISSIDGLHNISTISGTATSRGHTYYNLIDVVNFDTASKQRLEQFINTTETSQIFASNQLQTQNISFAYYLIDISANVENDFISEDGVKKNIFSVINRYYVQGGYLSGTNSGVEYTHQGEPMLISDFDIRILKPTGEVADNLKADNTVFLEIIRA
jgi:hypothetical protein